MGHEEEALELLLSNNYVRVQELTEKLNAYNKSRQDTEKNIYEEAIAKIKNEEEKSVIVLGSENWHHGVIGIVASKITEMYFKPTILLCFEDDIAKGSGRSVQGFDLHNALCLCSDLLEKYGGHEMAIGLSLKKENFNAFKEKFEQIASEYKVNEIIPVIYIDNQITSKTFNLELVKQLKLLEPFGEGNKVPIFIYKNLKIDSIRTLTEGRHLKLTLRDENNIINAIGFNMGDIAENYLIGDKVDVIGFLEINSYNGNETIQINMKDIMKSI